MARLFSVGLLQFLWELQVAGPGHYTASNAEAVLVATRSPIMPDVKLWPQIIFAPRSKHSHKPPHVHQYIEKAYPGQRFVEVYATETRPGWTCLGYEIDGRDVRDSIPAILEGESGRG
jgi:N6-adenosine-specific RNA methylase IME4